MRTVLITGASGGLGKELSLHFASKGWQVIATLIHMDFAEELNQITNIKCYELDVTSTESIEKAKAKILTDFPIIDVIINNAGMGYRSFVELAEDDKIKMIVDVNWLGVVKVCRAFIPVFRQQKQGHFINISSIAGLVNLPLGSFYHATKQAVESFSECMAYELLDFNCSVCTVQFGNAPTNFQKNVTKCPKTAIASYNLMMDKITALLQKKSDCNPNLTPKIANKLFEIATNPSKNFKRYTIGFDAVFMKSMRRLLGYKLFNRLIKYYLFK